MATRAKAKTETDEQSEQLHTVRHTTRGNRVIFSGTEDDARKFVENNFPRPHVEPGQPLDDEGPTPDVRLIGPDGAETVFFGPEHGWFEYGNSGAHSAATDTGTE